MGRSAAKFRQADVTRALKGAKAAGLEALQVKIGPDGSIEISADKTRGDDGCEDSVNPWDTI